MLDDLFSWENTLDIHILEDHNSFALSERKRMIIDELSDLEWRVKENKAELEKL